MRVLFQVGSVLLISACAANWSMPLHETNTGGAATDGRRRYTTGRETECNAGVPIGDFNLAHEKEEQVDRFREVAKTGKSGSLTAGPTCDVVRHFRKTCPAWPGNLEQIERDVCAWALRDAIAADRGRLAASLKAEGTESTEANMRRMKTLDATDKATLDLIADSEALVRDNAAYNRDVQGEDRSCQAIDAFEQRASAVGSATGKRYHELAKARREKQVADRKAEVNKRVTREYDLAEMDPPSAVLADVPAAKDAAALIVCYDAVVGKAMIELVDNWATRLQADIVAEEKCRATPSCMGDRVAAPLCQAVERRREAQEMMATERKNPAGVVNLKDLHDYGETIQHYNAVISDLKAKYVQVVRKPFSEAVCRK